MAEDPKRTNLPSEIILYSKPNCPLCDEGLEKLLRVARRHSLEVRKVDIREDPDLLARHGERIPVVTLGGEELGWGRLSEKGLDHALTRRLSGEPRGDGSTPSGSG
jgi:glutaredoxin